MMMLQDLYKAEAERISKLTDGKGDYTHPVFGEGAPSSAILLIGEAPGKQEAEQGRPFVGKAGEQLRRMLDISGIDSKCLYITNTVKYRPWKVKQLQGRVSYSNRTPDVSEIKEGCVLLEKEIKIISPKIIVTLGNTPLSAVEYITKAAVGKIGDVHGRAFELSEYNAVLFPLYHPASGIYNRSLIAVMEEDLKNLGKLSGKITEVK